MLKDKINLNLEKVISYVFIFLLLILSIKKGGFYKQDTIFFNLCVLILCIFYFAIKKINKLKNEKINVKNINIKKEDKKKINKNDNDNDNKKTKFDMFELLILMLPVSFMLPIVFNNYTNLNNSIFEMIRYFNLYFIYKLMKSLNTQNILLNGILVISFIQCIFGLDFLGNRYLENLLKIFSSSYLDKDLYRISGTFQYANVFGMLFLISIVILENKIINCIKNKKSKIKIIIFESFYVLFLTTMYLTYSRYLILLYFAYILYRLIKNKDKYRSYLISFYFEKNIISLLLMVVIYNILKINSQYLYISVILFLTIYLLFKIIIQKIISLNSIKFEKDIKPKFLVLYNKKCYLYIFLVIIYLSLALNITQDVNISNDNYYSKNIYDITNGKNNLKFDINDIVGDSRYKIEILQVDNENNVKLLKQINYYEILKITNSYDIELSENAKYLKIDVFMEKGNINFSNLYVNNKKVKLDYIFIPTYLVDRIQDIMNYSTSINDRLNYFFDSIKMSILSVKNLLFGAGGEAFNNLLDIVKTHNYNSTEAHSFIMQVFVETGIFGTLVLILIIVISFKNCKNNMIKTIFTLLLLHSMLDIEFSFMFYIALLGILLSFSDFKINISLNIAKILNLSKKLLVIAFSIFSIYLLINANIALNYNVISLKNEEDIDLNTTVTAVSRLEKRVNLDNFDIDYKKDLNDGYELFIDKISIYNDLNESYIKDVISNLEQNLIAIEKYDKYNIYTKEFLIENYIKFMDFFVSINHSNDYNYYYEKVANIYNYIKKNYNYLDNKQDILDDLKENIEKSIQKLKDNKKINDDTLAYITF